MFNESFRMFVQVLEPKGEDLTREKGVHLHHCKVPIDGNPVSHQLPAINGRILFHAHHLIHGLQPPSIASHSVMVVHLAIDGNMRKKNKRG